MEYLTRDPIIEAYFNFRNTNEEDVPVFSETVLRLAVKHVLQFKTHKENETLSMYRKLMTTMLHFNNGKSLDELEEIMICYTRNEIISILQDEANILESWKVFTYDEMLYFLRKNAFLIIMSEWIRRFTCIFGKSAIIDEKVYYMTLRIHDHFNWPAKNLHQWKRSFESKFLRGNSKEFDDLMIVDTCNVKESDLTVCQIVLDLQDKLHPLVYEDKLKSFLNSIKSFVSGTTRFKTSFKSRRRENESTTNISNEKQIKLEKFEEKFEHKQLTKAQTDENDDDDDDVEYVHVIEITEDDFEAEEHNNLGNNHNQMLTVIKDEKIDADYDYNDDCYGHVETGHKEVNKVTILENITIKTEETTTSSNNELIDDDKAANYLAALQAYCFSNGLFEAMGLLDQVDSIFRTKFEPKT